MLDLVEDREEHTEMMKNKRLASPENNTTAHQSENIPLTVSITLTSHGLGYFKMSPLPSPSLCLHINWIGRQPDSQGVRGMFYHMTSTPPCRRHRKLDPVCIYSPRNPVVMSGNAVSNSFKILLVQILLLQVTYFTFSIHTLSGRKTKNDGTGTSKKIQVYCGK